MQHIAAQKINTLCIISLFSYVTNLVGHTCVLQSHETEMKDLARLNSFLGSEASSKFIQVLASTWFLMILRLRLTIDYWLSARCHSSLVEVTLKSSPTIAVESSMQAVSFSSLLLQSHMQGSNQENDSTIIVTVPAHTSGTRLCRARGTLEPF